MELGKTRNVHIVGIGGALLVNGELWHVRAPTVAREAMRLVLAGRQSTHVASAR